MSFQKIKEIRQKYLDVASIYSLKKEKDCLYIYDKTNKYVLNVYEILPINVINITEEIVDKILTKYIEFLRKVNFDFKIVATNKKLDVTKYIYIMNKKNNKLKEKATNIYNEYILNMQKLLLSENIYITKYYIVVLSKYEQKEKNTIDEVIYSLAKTGCTVNKITKEEEILNVLYESINKEEVGSKIC